MPCCEQRENVIRRGVPEAGVPGRRTECTRACNFEHPRCRIAHHLCAEADEIVSGGALV
jgi:hypothetical protein